MLFRNFLNGYFFNGPSLHVNRILNRMQSRGYYIFRNSDGKNLIIKFKLLQNNNLIARSYIYYNVEPTLFSIYLWKYYINRILDNQIYKIFVYLIRTPILEKDTL